MIRHLMLRALGLSLPIALVLTGCDNGSPTSDLSLEDADPVLGLATFRLECASCHASGDGFDLAFFSFPDSTIVRRALGHVALSDALDIVAYIRSLGAETMSRRTRLFQPGGRVLADDRVFADQLFGVDAWPADLTSEELLAIDPRTVLVALDLPMWSVEEDNVDWMPDLPPAEGIFAFGGTGTAIEAYHELPTDHRLVAAVNRLRDSVRHPQNPAAPCTFDDARPVDYEECFQVQRWIASLGAQHMLRAGREGGLHRTVHDAFWDVGQTVRRSIVQGHESPANGLENWVDWMWTGWIFEPQNHATIYLSSGLNAAGLARHATFMTLRTLVARPAESFAPFMDVRNTARFAPDHWAGDATLFALGNLEERVMASNRVAELSGEELAEAYLILEQTHRIASLKDPAAGFKIREFVDRIEDLLPDL
ncbi:MAG: hypothetical protein BMS9Abin29_2566 [Gemmatimonadota bacterium]|nr:MAG: hypothetical protein BMS9Abin29_2566 [Gemmatimonadota bacterium]